MGSSDGDSPKTLNRGLGVVTGEGMGSRDGDDIVIPDPYSARCHPYSLLSHGHTLFSLVP